MSYRASVRQFNKFEWKEWSRVNRAKWDELAERARFIEADVYDALAAVPEPASFDLTFVSGAEASCRTQC